MIFSVQEEQTDLQQWLYHWSSQCDIFISDNEPSNSRLDDLTKIALNHQTGA